MKKRVNLFSSVKSIKLATWDVVTILVLLLVIVVACIFLAIFIDPNSSLNPLRPPTIPALIDLPTPTATMRSLPPVWTATSAFNPGATTPGTSQQGTNVVTTPQPSPMGGYPYALEGQPAGMSSTLFHAGKACEWMGVGGRVSDIQGSAVKGLMIRLGGIVNGTSIEEKFTLSGLAPSYGASGYEFMLGNLPIALSNAFWIRLEDLAQQPLSDTIYFNTYADCKRNLILINFKQVR